ncbi:MAG: cbb3-type cytochrome c oxidase subunit 3 [Melioribacteraceae bacterium]|nr:cbb3-type cytochrome c oxidase subunit 3 [Melioribacteraceae bacterium]MCF8355703.1 cbb3-type cytochrome c oxidase subunit 3 [Melioribacteraceae bacterium]MCF8394433.1 cbb3-type cytochrome c oxidase subunit 3 [Melioribacteraceae bacterium]MCF8418567.1 cbb3-type cytochrome c oxidase subunit 3 [Melioribacteraceae bacterium]
MIRDVLGSMEGVSGYAIFSLILFMGFFIGLIVWTMKIDKNYLNKMKMLPFESLRNKNNDKFEKNSEKQNEK